MKKIAIIGAGPRGLSIALYALSVGLNVTVIDPHPLCSWSKNQMLENLEMRSPISFDLVTYLPELQEFSLANFLGESWDFTNQVKVETNETKVLRSEFFQYLSFVWDYILPKINFIKKEVVSISDHSIVLLNKKKPLNFDYIVLASGHHSKSKLPFWIENTSYQNKVISTQQILRNSYTNKSFLVIGSGQGSAEYVSYLAKENKVTWLLKRFPKINQFPAPSYKEWKTRSALGNFYSYLPLEKRSEYLRRIKEWQPSITPTIKSLLDNSEFTCLFSDDLESQKVIELLEKTDHILIQTGFNPTIANLPIKGNIEVDRELSQFPVLTNFQLKDLPIFITGVLATGFDGPRQHSLVSAGLTSKQIINTILNHG